MSVRATGVARLQTGIEDVVFVSIEFAGDVLGHIHCSWLEPNKVRDATIVGSRKMAVYDDTAAEAKIRLYDKGIDRQAVDRGERDSRIGRYENFAHFQMLARAGDVILPRVRFAGAAGGARSDTSRRCVRGEEEPVCEDVQDAPWSRSSRPRSARWKPVDAPRHRRRPLDV